MPSRSALNTMGTRPVGACEPSQNGCRGAAPAGAPGVSPAGAQLDRKRASLRHDRLVQGRHGSVLLLWQPTPNPRPSGSARARGNPCPMTAAPRKVRPVRRIPSNTGDARVPALAALDLGTNNCRLLVARPQADCFEVIDSFSRIVRLGEGLAASGWLKERAMARTVAALRVCARIMARHSVRAGPLRRDRGLPPRAQWPRVPGPGPPRDRDRARDPGARAGSAAGAARMSAADRARRRACPAGRRRRRQHRDPVAGPQRARRRRPRQHVPAGRGGRSVRGLHLRARRVDVRGHGAVMCAPRSRRCGGWAPARDGRRRSWSAPPARSPRSRRSTWSCAATIAGGSTG